MSSDYISRLRTELLRAGATQPARRRTKRAVHRLRPLAVPAAIVAIIVVVAVAVSDGTEREVAAGTVQLSYRVQPADAAEATARNLRDRLTGLGVAGASVSASATRVTITAPEAARGDIAALTQPGEFAIYDWEASVLGPRGRPAPEDDRVTGGEDAGHAAALSEAEAKARGRAVQATAGRWFALGDDRGLTNADVASAEPLTDQANRQSIVELQLTAQGQLKFRELTRGLAQRGARLTTNPHLAIALDDRLLSVPYLDWRLAPDGVEDVQIAGDLTPRTARQIAAILNAGPLPGVLSPN